MSLEAKGNFTKAETLPTLADFTVVIKTAEGSEWRRWEKYGTDGIVVEDIPVGNYTMEAFHGTDNAAAWESPYFFGSTAFSINASEETNVSVTATLVNSKITLAYSEKTLADVENLEVAVTGKSGGILTYTATEIRAGYFAVPEDGVIKIIATGTHKSTKTNLQQTTTITGFKASQWYKITINLVPTSGSGSFQLAIDQSLINKEVDIEIPEVGDITGGGETPDPGPDPDPDPDPNPDPDPDPTPIPTPPTIAGASLNGVPFNIDQIVSVSQASESTTLDVALGAANGIAQLLIRIDSPAIPQEDLESMGLGGTFDMANVPPGSTLEQGLVGLGLIDLSSPIKGKRSHTFSIGAFMGMLATLAEPNSTHTFEIEVVDANGLRLKKSLVIVITE